MEKQKKLKVQIVEIDVGEARPQRYYVKHHSAREARAWLLEEKVTARPAEQDEVIEMAKDGVDPIGPFEKPKTALDDSNE